MTSHLALDSLGPYEPQPHLAVAVSGGADSMALACMAQQWVARHNGRITALTVDHRLRPESRKEAIQVGAWMHARAIPHNILTPEHVPAGNNLSAAARAWRYHALSAWCRSHNVLHLLIGHHQDDQAETAYMMHQRGADTDGVAGMPWVRNHNGVRILRPLLATPRAVLREYLTMQGQSWIEDPTNQHPHLSRTRVRAYLDAAPEIRATMLRNAANAADTRGLSDTAHAHACYTCVRVHGGTRRALVDYHAFRTLSPQAGCRLLADLLRSLRGSHTRPRFHETKRLYDALMHGQPHHTLYGFKITIMPDGQISVCPESVLAHDMPPITLPIAPARFWA